MLLPKPAPPPPPPPPRLCSGAWAVQSAVHWTGRAQRLLCCLVGGMARGFWRRGAGSSGHDTAGCCCQRRRRRDGGCCALHRQPERTPAPAPPPPRRPPSAARQSLACSWEQAPCCTAAGITEAHGRGCRAGLQLQPARAGPEAGRGWLLLRCLPLPHLSLGCKVERERAYISHRKGEKRCSMGLAAVRKEHVAWRVRRRRRRQCARAARVGGRGGEAARRGLECCRKGRAHSVRKHATQAHQAPGSRFYDGGGRGGGGGGDRRAARQRCCASHTRGVIGAWAVQRYVVGAAGQKAGGLDNAASAVQGGAVREKQRNETRGGGGTQACGGRAWARPSRGPRQHSRGGDWAGARRQCR